MATNDDEKSQNSIPEKRPKVESGDEVESDLAIASQLQMQEALAASLSSQSQIESDDVSASLIARLAAEDRAKLMQEISDRKLAEAVMQSMRDEIKRRAHDHAFARDLDYLSEEEWEKTGDWFERPFPHHAEASSSSAENFRLYFKGLVSEEMVGDVKKTLAGLGVAICDINDNLILELQKPFVVGSEEEKMMGEVVEIKALIEGLNAALSLDLKTLTICCHHNLLYQYITGKYLQRPGKIGTLVDQVNLLQTKFTRYNQIYVDEKNIKFAVNLARDAIVSQVTSPLENMYQTNNLKGQCVICLEDINITEMFEIDKCQHRYCFSCMKQHAEMKLLQGILPKCPHQGCNSILELEKCEIFLTSKCFDVVSQRVKEASIPATEKIYCPYLKCSALMSKTELCGASDALKGDKRSVAVKCIKCRGLFCLNCKVPWHKNTTCNEFKTLNPNPCREDAKLKSLATKKSWRQCVKCKHMVELVEGCNHISCRCGHEFCYTCGAEWKKKKATCECPLWDERNIIYEDHNRRRQRRRVE